MAEHLEEARADILAFTAFPRRSGARSGPTTPNERLNREILCRTDLVGIFSDRNSAIRLIGAVLASSTTTGQKDAATSASRSSARSRLVLIHTNETTTEKEDLTPAALTA